MKSLRDSIELLRSSHPKSVYAAGLCLKDGKLVGYKIYHKIYTKDPAFHAQILKFGGQSCLDSYLLEDDKCLERYPGFSGFTLGVEVFDKVICGYGFKARKNLELLFYSYYLNDDLEVIGEEEYQYQQKSSFPPAEVFSKWECDLVEVSRSNPSKWAFCPKFSHSSISSFEYDIKSSLGPENVAIFDYIKNLNDYYILNFGVNPNYEKIYIAAKNNREIDSVINLIRVVGEQFGKNSLELP